MHPKEEWTGSWPEISDGRTEEEEKEEVEAAKDHQQEIANYGITLLKLIVAETEKEPTMRVEEVPENQEHR